MSSDVMLTGLLGFALRATVLLGAAWLATTLLHRASAATRHLVWAAAIAGVLVLPLLSTVVPAWDVPVVSLTARIEEPQAVTDAPRVEEKAGVAVSPATKRVEEPVPPVAPATSVAPASPRPGILTRVSGRTALLVGWLALSLLMLARLAIASARVSYWQRESRPVDDERWLTLLRRLTRTHGIERPVVLLENGDTDIPVTWGTVYPVILLPATAKRWDDEQRVAVLTHELAHVKRFDALSQLLAQIALAVLWFHPLVWMAVRRMRLEREHACDDFVLASGTRASRYADDLLGLARQLIRPTAPAAAALAMARRSELEGRLLAILDPAAKRTTVRRARVGALALGVLALATPLAAFRPAARIATLPLRESSETSQTITLSAPSPADSHATIGAPEVTTAPQSQLPDFRRDMARIGLLSTPKPKTTLEKIPTDTEPPPPVDIETLIAITRATKRFTSDYEKGQMLALVAKRYQPNDTLREAYIDAVVGMTSDHERSKALIALLDRDSLPATSTARVLRSALMMTSDLGRAQVLKRIGPTTFADTAVQRAYLDVLAGMTGNSERAGAISSLVKQRPLAPTVQIGLIRAIGAITSNSEKANTLLLFAQHQGIADDSVRRAFLRTAESLTSDFDYRRVISAVVR